MENNFREVDKNELEKIDGGLTVAGGVLAGTLIVLGFGAAVSFFNGFSDAAGK